MAIIIISGQSSSGINLTSDVLLVNGGTANDTTINSSGAALVSNGGVMNDVLVNSYGGLRIASNGSASGIKENGGYVEVQNGGAAKFDSNTFSGLVLSSVNGSGARATLHEGTTAFSTTILSGGLQIFDGGLASSVTVSNGSVDVHAYGSADLVIVNSHAELNISSMGDVTNIKENGGYVSVAAGANATFVANSFSGLVLDSRQSATVHSGTTANSTTVNSGGELVIYSGGVASAIKENGGYVEVADGKNVTFVSNSFSGVVLRDRSATLHSGTTANSTTLNSQGSMYVYRGGVANATTVNESGTLYVYSGGVANDITLNGDTKHGYIHVYEGAVANSVTVNAGGDLQVSSGGRVSDRLTIAATGASVNVESGGIIDFDISSHAPGEAALLNHYDLVGGTPTLTITVAGADQENGAYSLAKYVDDKFDVKTEFAVYTDNGDKAGTLIVGDSLAIGSGKYELALADKTLTLTVSGNADSGPEVLSITATPEGPTNRNVTVTATFSKKAVTQEYSLDNYTWEKYFSTGVVVTENGTVYFRGADSNNKYSEVKSYKVANIDRVPPEAPTAKADITAPTEDDVTVTATFSTDTATKQYSLDNTSWKAYETGVVMADNGTVYFRGLDAAGNISKVTEYVVSNINSAKVLSVTATPEGPTNQNVTVTATYSSDTTTKQYALDGSTWLTYTGSVVMTDNGTVYFRALDAEEKPSKVVEYTVANIDRVPPDAPVASADITVLTKQNVTVTATYSNDSATKEYSLDGQTWLEYSEPVVMKENGTVYFRGADEAGNISDVTEYTVANIDRVPPEKPVVSADITTPTNRDVTVCATFGGDTVKPEYSLDGKSWLAYTAGVVMTDNGTVYFRGIDAAGNESPVAEYTVANIDKVAPDAPVASADITKPTNKTVTVTATFSKDSVQKAYSYDGKRWSEYTTGIAFDANGKVYFRGTDAAGNVSLATEYDVTNIADGKTTFAGSLGFDGIYQQRFTPELPAPGLYNVRGDFGVFNGSLKIMDGDGRKVASGKIKNGAITFNHNQLALLDSAEKYTVVVTTSDKNRRAADYSFEIATDELFDKGDNSDDKWTAAPAMAPGDTLNNWVGYGDAVDWRSLVSADNGGVYGLFLSDVRERVKVTVYAKQGGELTKVKSFSANDAKRTASLQYLTLAPATRYYIAVEAPGAKKAKNSDYKLLFTERAVFNWDDNNWGGAVELAEVGGRSGALTTAADGDRVDYTDLTGVEKFTVTMTDGKAKVTFYDENLNKVKVGYMKMADDSIRAGVSSLTLKNGSVTTNSITLSDLDDSIKYLKVEAAAKTLCAYTIA